MFRRSGLVLLSLLLSTGALLVPTAPAGAGATATPSADGARQLSLPLRVDGERIRDARGRDVVLRGINVGEKGAPFLRDLDRADFRRLRGLGFNHVRLYTSWEAVMPHEGEVDRGYLRRLRAQVRQLGRHGLLVVLDMHQDVYGGPIGGGAPDWAYDPLGCPHVPFSQPTGAWGADYLSPATLCAFTNFWTSDRLQQQYAAAWSAVAASMGEEANVIGYDLMNEPFPGLIPPGVFDRQYLFPSQARWLAAIREQDPESIGFLEPSVLKSETVVELPPVGLMPANTVYAPHLYGPWDHTEGIEALQETRAIAEPHLRSSQISAQAAGVPLWLGEWGVFTGSAGAADYVTQVYDMLDAAGVGTALWVYDHESYGPYSAEGVPTPIRDAVRRPYPEAVPGTLGEIRWDAPGRRLEVDWTDGQRGLLLLQVPRALFPDGLVVSGGRRVSWSGGRLVVRVADGAGQLVLRGR